MIKHIKLSDYKGIEGISLFNLGQINVISGKNNSGKSSILESMLLKDKYSIGVDVDASIKPLFYPLVARYGEPNPDKASRWFNNLIDNTILAKEIWFEKEISTIEEQIKNAMKQDPYMGRFDKNFLKYDQMLEKYFKPYNEDFKPFLIPPKRAILPEKKISTDEEIIQTGEGILNRLFYLKNQDIKSADYKIFTSIYNEFECITGRNFNIIPRKSNSIELYFNNAKDEWIPSKNCGLGLSDVLIIIGLINLTEYTCYLIEEPENHLHAEYQKRLLDFFKRKKSKQFFLATHSNIFLDPSSVDKIVFTEFVDHVKASDVTSRSIIISSLGYSVTDNLSSDLIILTEGPTDIPILKEIFKWKKIDLQYNIKFWPLCGDIMSKLDLEVIAQDHAVLAFIDSDFQSKEIRDLFKRNCQELKIKCFQLERYAIENYLTLEAIRSVFQDQVPENVTKLHPKRSVKSQIGFNIKNKNYQIIKAMTLSDLESTDLLEFCNTVEKLLKQNVT